MTMEGRRDEMIAPKELLIVEMRLSLYSLMPVPGYGESACCLDMSKSHLKHSIVSCMSFVAPDTVV